MEWRYPDDASQMISSIGELVRLRAEQQPDALAYRFLVSGDVDGPIDEWTYGQVDGHARSVASYLQKLGATAGERALLLYPPGLEFIAAFLGCVYCGVIAVPAYPHRRLARLEVIAQDSLCRFVLSSRSFLEIRDSLAKQTPQLKSAQWLATSDIPDNSAGEWRPPNIERNAVAFLQYTSGSTGEPKGVVVTHDNILQNELLIQQAFGTDSQMHVVGWLPVYHDMGLIGNVLQPLFIGASCTLLSPLSFLQRPLRWLRAISRFRATVSGGPNFAYDLCVSKLLAGEKLDLSSWKVAFNGSEPVRSETLFRFARAFAPFGFKSEAFLSCYGLAEATLLVSGSAPGAVPYCLNCSAENLEQHLAVEVPVNNRGVRTLVSAGRPKGGHKVVIVDAVNGSECPDGVVGEIWVSGPSVAGGYWNRAAENAQIFSARLDGYAEVAFLRTGDLGFFWDGELYVTGRAKDLLIFHGRNFYPQDIESVAQAAHPAVKPGGCAAFSVDADGEERLIVLAEIGQHGIEDDGIMRAIDSAIAEEFGVSAHAVVLLPPRSIPKTSSGKIRRHQCRKDFLETKLPVLSFLSPENRRRQDSVYVAPATPLQARLACIWADTLGLERVGVEDDFFALGGHSLLATQIIGQINDEFGLELPLRRLFEARTVASLANMIDMLTGSSEQRKKTSPIKKVARPAVVSRAGAE